MSKKLSILLTSVLVMGSLTGCSGSGNVAGEDNKAPLTSNEQNKVEATPESNAAAGTVKMYNGEMPIPEKTEHIAVLDLNHIDHLTALGITPAAANIPAAPTEESTPAQRVSWADGFGRIFADYDLSDVMVLNNNDNPNIEKLLMVEPEYIIAGDGLEEHLSKLEAVAPVYMIDSTLNYDEKGYRDWRQTHRLIGEITGTSDKAEENIQNYDNLVEGYIKELGKTMEGSTAMVFQLDTKGIQYATADNYAAIYDDFGFDKPHNIPEGSRETIAVENLVDINPDYIFMTIESYEDFAVLEASPIWQNLEAVKNGNVYEFAHYGWNRNNGCLSNTLKLQEVGDFLLHGTQTSARFDLVK